MLAEGRWTHTQKIGLVTAGFQDSALKWFGALISRDLDKQDWEVVKIQLLKSYGIQIITTAACKLFSKLYQVSRSVLDYGKNHSMHRL